MKINVDEHSVLALVVIFIVLLTALVFGWIFVSWLGLFAIQKVGIIEDYNFWDVVIFALFFTFSSLLISKGKEK
jgi:hypothetical protein